MCNEAIVTIGDKRLFLGECKNGALANRSSDGLKILAITEANIENTADFE